MRRSVHWTLILGALLALTFGVAACGGDDGGGEQDTNTGTPAEGKKGGKLVALWAGDTDNIDPGITYSQWGLPIIRATQKTLYRPKIDDGSVVEPDLAEADPEIAEDGCTVTVTIKTGVKFSPPVDREVTSKDVKYAIERGFFSNANNGYAQPYFGGLKGAKVGAKPGTKIPGIETPDDTTIVFNLAARRGSRQVPRRHPRPGARHAAVVTGAGGVREGVRRRAQQHLRPEPGRDRPVHDRERRRGQGDRL